MGEQMTKEGFKKLQAKLEELKKDEQEFLRQLVQQEKRGI